MKIFNTDNIPAFAGVFISVCLIGFAVTTINGNSGTLGLAEAMFSHKFIPVWCGDKPNCCEAVRRDMGSIPGRWDKREMEESTDKWCIIHLSRESK